MFHTLDSDIKHLTLALFLALGASEQEAEKTLARLYGQPLPDTPQGIVNEAKAALNQVRDAR